MFPGPRHDSRDDRFSEAPLSVDVTGSVRVTVSQRLPVWVPPQVRAFVRRAEDAIRELAAKVPPQWSGMTGYLAAGVFLGLALILAFTVGGGNDPANAAAAPDAVTDNVVHLHAREINESCWRAYEKEGPARVTVSLEVGMDGKVRYAVASGATPELRGCVEAHVKAWEFLPQTQAQTMALPVEIDRR